MAAIRCSCGQTLAPHCGGDCDWLVCGNQTCTAWIYDTHRGLLMRRDRSVVGWSEA